MVWGDFEEDEGTVEGHIGRSQQNRKIMDVFPDGDMGKHAVTHYKVLERFGYVTLIECRLRDRTNAPDSSPHETHWPSNI